MCTTLSSNGARVGGRCAYRAHVRRRTSKLMTPAVQIRAHRARARAGAVTITHDAGHPARLMHPLLSAATLCAALRLRLRLPRLPARLVRSLGPTAVRRRHPAVQVAPPVHDSISPAPSSPLCCLHDLQRRFRARASGHGDRTAQRVRRGTRRDGRGVPDLPPPGHRRDAQVVGRCAVASQQHGRRRGGHHAAGAAGRPGGHPRGAEPILLHAHHRPAGARVRARAPPRFPATCAHT